MQKIQSFILILALCCSIACKKKKTTTEEANVGIEIAEGTTENDARSEEAISMEDLEDVDEEQAEPEKLILQSGEYSSLNLAVNGDKVSGYLEDQVGGEGKFSCIFLFHTISREGNKIKVDAFPPTAPSDRHDGWITIEDESTFKLWVDDMIGGCWNVIDNLHGEEKEGASFSIDKKENWKAVYLVESAKAYFYDEKSDASKRKSYVVKKDIVYATEIDGDWAKCNFYGSKSTTTGWMKVSDFYE